MEAELVSQLIKIAIPQGIFAVLFVVLLAYVLKENSRRESRLMDFITEHTTLLQQIKDGLVELNGKADRLLNGVADLKARRD